MIVPGSANPILSTTEETGYKINKSLRIRGSAGAYLSRTPASAGNSRTFTWSAWLKRSSFGSEGNLFEAGLWTYNNQIGVITFAGSDGFAIAAGIYGVNTEQNMLTTQVFRDPAAWYHIVVAVDTTQATASNRIKMYVNGTQITAFTQVGSYNIYPSQNYSYNINSVASHRIGNDPIGNQYDGYIAENHFIDGQQLDPTYFGETDVITGVWKPKAYSGTYGTNGFYLKFTDIALTSGSNAGLGKDFSGNGNYWTTNNISVTSGSTYDSMKDVPTLTDTDTANYATLNTLQNVLVGSGSPVITDGGLKVASSASSQSFGSSTISVSSGKFYAEMTMNSLTSDGSVGAWKTPINSTNYFWQLPDNIYYYSGGAIYYGGSTTGTTYNSFTTGDIIGVALDMDNGKIYFSKNGTWQGSSDPATGTNPAYSGLTGSYQFGCGQGGGGGSNIFNFGQRPFSYTPPTGYKALNTYNLPDSTIKSGNVHMEATIYSGNSSNPRSIVNAAGFKPDLVWIKNRTTTNWNNLFDSVRGSGKVIYSNSTTAESTNASTGYLSAFNSNGFAVTAGSTNADDVNTSGNNYVAWQWKAGEGSSTSNTNGSITSTVSANTTAGFSVVSYTGNATLTATVGHGLGVAPSMIFFKRRDTTAQDWGVYHKSLGLKLLQLNTSSGAWNSGSNYWYSAPSSSVLYPDTTNGDHYQNISGGQFVAYCWAAIPGFSDFGGYTGNGSNDGVFIYTGFRPKYIVWKNTTVGSNDGWYCYDSVRGTYNIQGPYLSPSQSIAEGAQGGAMDFLSNGFKIRNTGSDMNTNGSTYIYAAFAENPFKNALAR